MASVTEPKLIRDGALPPGRPWISASLDPRFFFVFTLERVVSGEAPWRPESEVVCLIHSPAQTFSETKPGGKRYRLMFHITADKGKDLAYRLRSVVEASAREVVLLDH